MACARHTNHQGAHAIGTDAPPVWLQVSVDAGLAVGLPVMSDDSLAVTRKALADCDAVVDRLHKMCCEPDRSPRMLAIKDTIVSVSADLDASSDDTGALDRALASLMDIGAQIGYLQVGCCAPARMPLYADALNHLSVAQLNIDRPAGMTH
jgi:hypothetical protein